MLLNMEQFLIILGRYQVDLESWNVIWYAIIWSLWLGRNNQAFNDQQVDMASIVEHVQLLAWK